MPKKYDDGLTTKQRYNHFDIYPASTSFGCGMILRINLLIVRKSLNHLTMSP